MPPGGRAYGGRRVGLVAVSEQGVSGAEGEGVHLLREEAQREREAVPAGRADGEEITFTVTTGEGYPPPLVKSLTPRGERNAVRPEPFEVTARRTK